MRPIPLAAANLGAVVPGFRSEGLGNFGDGFKYIGIGVAALMLWVVLKGRR